MPENTRVVQTKAYQYIFYLMSLSDYCQPLLLVMFDQQCLVSRFPFFYSSLDDFSIELRIKKMRQHSINNYFKNINKKKEQCQQSN